MHGCKAAHAWHRSALVDTIVHLVATPLMRKPADRVHCFAPLGPHYHPQWMMDTTHTRMRAWAEGMESSGR